MGSEEPQVPLDYLKLSELYASFLAALGGVSITVLTLVLTLPKNPVAGILSRFSVAALSVATISCFTGAHLMAETAAVISKSKDSLSVGARLFFLASINIYIAAMLLIFTVVLLTVKQVKWISVLVFPFVLLITLCWMYVSATSRFEPAPTHPRKAAGLAICFGVAVGITMYKWAASPSCENCFLFASFVLSVVATALSFCYFVWISKSEKDRKLDVWFYSLAIALSCLSLFGAGMGLVLRK